MYHIDGKLFDRTISEERINLELAKIRIKLRNQKKKTITIVEEGKPKWQKELN